MDLYPYQIQLIDDLYKKINSGLKKILLFAPTGAGKTVIISRVIQDAVSKNRHVLFLVHRNELINQTLDKLKKFGMEAGVIKAGWKADNTKVIQIASVQTLNKRLEENEMPEGLDIAIIDECHTISYYRACKTILENHEGIIIGVSATPWRTKRKEGLKEYYDGIVKAPLPRNLIEQGFLVEPVYFSYPEIDLSGVKIRSGDYALEELEVEVNTPKINKKAVEEYNRLTPGKRAIGFCTTVNHSICLAVEFENSGIRSEYIEGNTPIKERAAIFKAFRAGDIKMVSSVGVLTTGFDETRAEVAIDLRPTKSRALKFQKDGRVMRISPDIDKKKCYILDFALNTERHGRAQDLEDIEMDVPDDKEYQAPIKRCPECNFVMRLDEMVCPHCGHEILLCPKKKKEILDNLEEYLPKEEKRKRNQYWKLARQAYEKRYHPSWIAVKYKDKYHSWPPKTYMKGAVFGLLPTLEDMRRYYEYLNDIIRIKEGSAKPILSPRLFVETKMKAEFGEEKFIKHVDLDTAYIG